MELSASRKDWTGTIFPNGKEVLNFAGVRGSHGIWNYHCVCGEISCTTIDHIRSNPTCFMCRSVSRRNYPNRQEVHLQFLFTSISKGAAARDLKFTLEYGPQFRALVLSSCYICGRQPERRMYIAGAKIDGLRKKEIFYANGLDRLFNDRGYIWENVRPCCYNCNISKKDLTFEQVRRVYFEMVMALEQYPKLLDESIS